MSADITIFGLDSLLLQLSADIPGASQEITLAVGEEVKTRLQVYPPETQANSPANNQYYVRGTGGFYRSTRTGQTHQTSTSEHLGDSWQVTPQGGGNTSVTNTASYAPWVQYKESQTAPMARIGWSTDESVLSTISEADIDALAEPILNDILGI